MIPNRVVRDRAEIEAEEHRMVGVRTPPNQQNGNVNGNRGWQGIREMDAHEAAYFNTSDDEDELRTPRDSPIAKRLKTSSENTLQSNGVASSTLLESLVDYPNDDDVAEKLFCENSHV